MTYRMRFVLFKSFLVERDETAIKEIKKYIAHAFPIAKKITVKNTKRHYLNVYIDIDEIKYQPIVKFYDNSCEFHKRRRRLPRYGNAIRLLSFGYFIYRISNAFINIKIARVPYLGYFANPHQFISEDAIIFYGNRYDARIAIHENFGRKFYIITFDYFMFIIPHDEYPKEFLDALFIFEDIWHEVYDKYENIIAMFLKMREAIEKYSSPGLKIFFEKLDAETAKTSLDMLAKAL
jgi:hypothetical protein